MDVEVIAGTDYRAAEAVLRAACRKHLRLSVKKYFKIDERTRSKSKTNSVVDNRTD